MLNQTRFTVAMLMTTMAVALASCGTKSVEETFNITNAPVPGIVAPFGKNSFSFSSGASRNYEISRDKVIPTGSPVAGAYTIKGDTLVGDKFTFAPRDANDQFPVNLGPRGMSNARNKDEVIRC